MKSFRLDTPAAPAYEQQRIKNERRARRVILLGLVAAVLLLAWTADVFDNFLWRVGLNHSTCIQNGFGATFCGDAAERYQKLIQP